MGKLTLVTGGARSGKSLFAEGLVKGYGKHIVYVATAVPLDDEMKQRIQTHKERRPASWETVEAYKDIGLKLKDRTEGISAGLIDCITVMITNLMFDKDREWDHLGKNEMVEIENQIKAEIEKLIDFIRECKVPFVAVTNEVGMGLVPDTALGRIFRDIAGRANQLLAKTSDEVYFCVSGIPVKIK